MVLACFYFTSCNDQKLESSFNAIDENDPVFKRIISLGFTKSDVQDLGQYYLVEGDITFSKSSLQNLQPTSNGRSDQASRNELISFDRQPTVSIRIDNSMPLTGVDNWRAEIQQAINDWNSVGDSRINMVLVDQATTQTSITIISDNAVPNESLLRDDVVAVAEFPFIDGRPGFRVRVNLDFNSNRTVTTGQKRRNIVHELGHCIGFRHTNWNSLNESSANTIPGTPQSDNASVMNGGTALNE